MAYRRPDFETPEDRLAPEPVDTWALAVRLHHRTSRRSTEPATPAERPANNPTPNAGEGPVAAGPSSVPPRRESVVVVGGEGVL